LPALVVLVGLFFGITGTYMMVVLVIYFVIAFIGMPMYANKIYYNRTKKEIRKIDKKYNRTDKAKYISALTSVGGTNGVSVVLAAAILTAIIAVPLFQSYMSNTKAERITDVITSARTKIESYAIKNKKWPRSERDISFNVPADMVGELDLVVVKGIIELGVEQEPGKTARFVPSVNKKGHIVWKCEHGDIDSSYLPLACYKK